MENKPVIKKVGEAYETVFSNRGSTGLSIQWEISDNSIASVERMENMIPNHVRPGDPIQTKYRISFLKKGQVTIHFYETQVWNDAFPKITLNRFLFSVE